MLDYLKAVQSGTVGASFVRGFSCAMNAADRREKGFSVSNTAPKMETDDVRRVLEAIAHCNPDIDASLAAKGLKWLQSASVQRKLGERERRIVGDFDHYTLAGFADGRGQAVAYTLPVWRVHSRSHGSFDYYAGSWQSGIPLTVTS